MDEATLKAAQVAEDALRGHHRSCPDGCNRLGVYESGRHGYKRCDRGKELYTSWDRFRPEPIRGSHIAPGGERLKGYVVDKVENVGPYEIAYLLKDASGLNGVKHWAKHRSLVYQAYVDGKSEGFFWDDVDIDVVLLAAMEFRRSGKSAEPRNAAYYARKVLDVAAEDDE